MKKLICVKEMEEFIKTGKTKFYVTSDMIITPSAKDLAKNKSIELTTESQGCELKSNINLNLSDSDLDSEAMLKLFKAMMNKGLLQEVLKCLKGENLPYESECDVNGLKIVRGNTVKLDVFDTGNPDARYRAARY